MLGSAVLRSDGGYTRRSQGTDNVVGGLYRRAYSQLKLRYTLSKRTSEQTVDEVLPAESTWVSVSFCLCANRPNVSTCHQRRHPLAVGGLDADLVTHMHEYVLVTHADQRQFAEI